MGKWDETAELGELNGELPGVEKVLDWNYEPAESEEDSFPDDDDFDDDDFDDFDDDESGDEEEEEEEFEDREDEEVFQPEFILGGEAQ